MRIKSFYKFLLIYAIFIILWGAFVRISHSGAGCGDSWPLCGGELSPSLESREMFIEFFHRFTSGLFGLLVLIVTYIAYKDTAKGSITRTVSMLFLILTILEGLFGAMLVKLELVTDNNSMLRALVIIFHLLNTFCLNSCLLFLSKFYGDEVTFSSIKKRHLLNFGITALFFLLVSSFGAIAALSNTLYPSESLVSGIKSDLSLSVPMYVALRKYHPLIALPLFYFLYSYITQFTKKNINYLILLLIHFVFALATLLFLAPIWMKLGHLLIANIVFLAFINVAFDNFFKKNLDT